MKRNLSCLILAMFVTSSALMSQTVPAVRGSTVRPFSRLAVGGGLSLMGVDLQAATNVNQYLNLRGTGNFFSYSVDNITTNGMTLNGNLNFAAARVSVDYFPFPNHGLRLSPGALFYNQNAVSANVTVAGGTSFKLNDVQYYSSNSSPVVGIGRLGLNAQNPAFTMTTGWGNMIPRRRGHWSAPVEVGAAIVGVPSVKVAFTSGQVCNSEGVNCVNAATDPGVQANLQAQIAKYTSDLNAFRFYPIVSFGLTYSFRLR
jgi:hypothetical protein